MTISTSSIAKASRVDRAFERLEAALDRLENAVNDRPEMPAADNSAVESLQRENASLRDLNRLATEKLDVAIGRLERVLAPTPANVVTMDLAATGD